MVVAIFYKHIQLYSDIQIISSHQHIKKIHLYESFMAIKDPSGA